jgi:hypothetical protein
LLIKSHRVFIKNILTNYVFYLNKKDYSCPPETPEQIKARNQRQREADQKVIAESKELVKKLAHWG